MSNIPVILLSRDRLTTLEKLCDQLTLLGYDNIIIYDSGSTYQPLLNWFKTCPYDVYLANNSGHKAIWTNGFLKKLDMWPWVVISDSDIELNMDTPKGFIEQMIMVAKDYRVDKVGLGIEYKDITNQYLKRIIEPIESQYWKQRLVHDRHQVTAAPTDTTFCVVQPHLPFQYHGVRVNDWPIKHLPWYESWDNLTEEQLYYHNHADPAIATGTAHYLKYLASK